MIGLQSGREASTQAHRPAKTGDDTNFLRHQHQILHAHDLRHGCRHFRGQAGGEGAQAVFIGVIAEQPVAQAADREVADDGKRLFIVGVDDQSGDFIVFVGDQGFFEKMLERNVGQRHLRGHALAVIERRNAREKVAGACGAGLGHDVLEAVEAVGLGADGMGKSSHGRSPPVVLTRSL